MNFHDRQTTPASPAQAEQLMDLMARVVRCCQEQVAEQAARFGVPPAQLRCLLLFRRRPRFRLGEIASGLEVTRSRATALVEGLVRRGLVRKQGDPGDGRARQVVLTAGGARLLREVEAYLHRLHRRLLDWLPPEERARVLEGLSLLEQAMERMKQAEDRECFGP